MPANSTFLRASRYSAWQKAFIGRRFAFAPIILFHLHHIRKKRWPKILAFFCFANALFFIFAITVQALDIGFLAQLKSQLPDELLSFGPLYFSYFIKATGFLWFIFIIIACGSIITMDRKYNGIMLYLVKPINPLDYLAGKFGTVFLLLAAVSFLPAMLIFATKMLVSLDFTLLFNSLGLLLALLAYFFVYLVSFSSFVICFSAIFRNPKIVHIFMFIAYLIMDGLAEMMVAVMRSDYFYLLSLDGCYDKLAAALFAGKTVPGAWWYALAPLLWALLMLLLTRRIIRKSTQ